MKSCEEESSQTFPKVGELVACLYYKDPIFETDLTVGLGVVTEIWDGQNKCCVEWQDMPGRSSPVSFSVYTRLKQLLWDFMSGKDVLTDGVKDRKPI